MSPLVAIGRQYGFAIGIGLLILFGTVFLVNARAELADAIALLGRVSLLHILLLAGLQLIVIAIAGLTYKIMLRRRGHRLRWSRLSEIQLRRILIGTITPVGGPASLYVLVRALRPYGVPANDALIAASIRSSAGLIAFMMLLVPTLLLQSHSTLVLAAASVLVVGLALFLTGATLLLRCGEVPAFLQRWLPSKVLQFVETAREHRITALDFAVPTAAGFASHVASTTMLYVGLAAVGYDAGVGAALIGYVIGKLFFMMAPFFQGVGVVEFGVVLALQQAGTPAAVAVSASLLYRVGDLWMPTSWGMLIQLVRMPLVSRLADRLAGITPAIAGAQRTFPQVSPTAVSQVVRMGQLVLSLAVTFTLSAVVWSILGSGAPPSL